MKIHEFRKLIDKIDDAERDYENKEVTVVLSEKGSVGATPSIKVRDAHVGFDWDAGQIMIYTQDKVQKAPYVNHDCSQCQAFNNCRKIAKADGMVRCVYFNVDELTKRRCLK